MAQKQREISVSEFFVKNRHLLGFDNPSKALLTTIKEAVDNSLDACEEGGLLPELHVEVHDIALEADPKPRPRGGTDGEEKPKGGTLTKGEGRFLVMVQDNGPGIVKAQVPKIKLDDVFEKKDDIADIVKSQLSQVMEGFGYGILKALVTDIDPDPKVKQSMNEINAAQRMRVAATEKGEADRILKVKAAEGDAQSKALQGRGIADQRQAIVAGLRDSVDEFRRSVPGTTAKDVMNLVLMTQYFDTLKEIGASSRSNTILIPHSPGSLASLSEQIRNAMIEANQTVEGARPEAFAGVGNGEGGIEGAISKAR